MVVEILTDFFYSGFVRFRVDFVMLERRLCNSLQSWVMLLYWDSDR